MEGLLIPPEKRAAPGLALFAVLLLGTSLEGQMVLDWPMRAGPEPEALLTGAAAAAWNPAGMSEAVGGTSGLWLLHLDGPDEVGIGGVTAAATGRLPWVGQAGIAYAHVGISGIPRTSTSPDPEPGEIRVADDAWTLALARELFPSGAVGAALRYVRSSGGPDEIQELGVDLGASFRTELPLRPRLGALVRGLGAGLRIMAALGLTPPPTLSGPLAWDLAMGIDANTETHRTEHRVSVRGTWRSRYHVAAGINRAGDDGWTALWMVGADVGRYSLAVMREALVNEFGAAHYYRLAIRLP